MNGESYGSRESGRSRDHYSSRHDRDRGDERRERDRGDRRERGDRGDRRDRETDRGDRRRSRSPHYRSSRREYDDSYSSSRDYRAKEREDRYSSRRDDREWNRDRGPRRRDDDRRGGGGGGGGGRDRGDLFDERRGGGRDRGAREDRDEFAAQARGRKESPQPAKKREPTPDLTDVVSVLQRKRRLTQWDIKPPGYENVTAEQAKLSGMFPLPGAPRQQMDPSKLQAFINQPGGGADSAALKPSNARQSKRLFAYNVPATATEASIISFFNLQLNGLNVIKNPDPLISAAISTDRSFALLEFKSAEDATVALAMSGITMEEHLSEANGNANGGVKGLDLKRPKDYIVPAAESDVSMEGGISSEVPDTENKICVTKIPTALEDSQVMELFQAFGELKSFVMVKDNGTGESRGIAFCEYLSPEVTAMAVEGLAEVPFDGVKLNVTLASIGFKQAAGLEMGVNAMSMFAGTTAENLEDSRVLQLLNMVTPEELIDNDEYEEICEDVKEECEKYGKVIDLKIPRPAGGSRQSAGVGKIFIKFIDAAAAKKALQSLAGRKFADRTVVTSYFDESSFDVNAW